VQAVLFPPVCAACGTATLDSADALCLSCWEELSLVIGHAYCMSCGEDRQDYLLTDGQCTKCRIGDTPYRFDGFARVGRYDGTLRQLILSFKRRFVLDGLLGKLLGDAILGRFEPGDVDYWVPVPAHWRRRLRVGFQPTWLLACAATKRWGGRVEPVLAAKRYVRPFHTRVGLSAQARAEAIRGVFRACGGWDLRGKTVCVVDDVTTTGATLREARGVLRKAGAKKVLAAVLAKAASGGPAGLDQVGRVT
jgi:predicted amidophosphoribosyltransferase